MSRTRRAPGAMALLLLGLIQAAQAAPRDCPVPVEPGDYEDPSAQDINVTANSAEVTPTGESVFQGNVEISQAGRTLQAEELRYDPATGKARVSGISRYRDPAFEIAGEDLRYDAASGEAEIIEARFRVPSVPARGEAEKVRANGRGQLVLEDIMYTSCLEQDNPDWELKARRLKLDATDSRGEARDVRLRFKDATLLYLPYLSFPLDRSRKTGFLFPEVKSSHRSGTELEVPFYWNIAPNYDATITPNIMSERGVQWVNEFRYLTPSSGGQLDLEYLHDDNEFGDDRHFVRWVNDTALTSRWRARADVQDASDRQYFEDLGTGIGVTSQTHLLRNVEFAYLARRWEGILRARNYQTIDGSIPAADKPYERLPQLLVNGLWDMPAGLQLGWDSELVNFTRETGVEGVRLSLEPSLRLPIEGPGYFLIPRVAWRHIRYELDNVDPATEDAPSLSAPLTSLDAGLVFERETRSGEFVQTLQPRLLYAHIPYRSQSDMPVFDTGRPDFNVVQLFRPNRFIGGDRLGDTDQVSVGVTTRLLDAVSGREFLTATLGQAFFLSDRNIALPGESAPSSSRSNLVGELGLDIFRDWNAGLGYQWDPDASETALAEIRLQYRPADNRVANLHYRFRPDLLEQVELSVGWPVTETWSFVGQIEYSLRDEATIDRLIGVQYESCCWAARLGTARHISDRDGTADTTVMLQLEFKGLGGLGSGARSTFESDILGYSVYD